MFGRKSPIQSSSSTTPCTTAGRLSAPGPDPGRRAQAVPTGTARWSCTTRDGPDGVLLERTRHAWYHGPLHRPYRDQRHRASRTGKVSVRPLALHR
jgi:hypothetical protein